MAAARHSHALHPDFDCSCHAPETCDDTLTDVPRILAFGEFLVWQQAIDRHQLLRALQMQDDNPGIRLGECMALLGLLHPAEIECHLGFWLGTGEAEPKSTVEHEAD